MQSLLLMTAMVVGIGDDPSPRPDANAPPQLFLDQPRSAGDAPSAAIFQADPPDAPWRFDLIVGLPVSLRVQRQISGSWWWEIGASLYLNVPAAYTAIRFDMPMEINGYNSVHVRPGLGVAVTGAHTFENWDNGNSVFWATGDVDVVWRHCWSEGIYGEFGFKLGMVFPVNVSQPFPMPRAALIFGIQF